MHPYSACKRSPEKILDHHNEEKKCVMFSVSPQYKHKVFLSGKISAHLSDSNVTDLRSQIGDGGLMACAETESRYSHISGFGFGKGRFPTFKRGAWLIFKLWLPDDTLLSSGLSQLCCITLQTTSLIVSFGKVPPHLKIKLIPQGNIWDGKNLQSFGFYII